jgi:hypothetical protein
MVMITNFAQEHAGQIAQLVLEAEKLQEKRDYTAAAALFGKILSLKLSQSRSSESPNHASDIWVTIERIIALLCDQHPQLANKREVKDPFTSLKLLFPQLPIETGDLNTLLAIRAIADWCCYPGVYHDDLAHSLYARLYCRMEKVVGLQHLETSRLLYHWGRCGYSQVLRWSHTYPRTPFDGRVMEERCQAALLGLDEVLGRHDPETIDCASILGHIYLEQGKYSLAQATFKQLYQGQVTELGTADDRTLLSLSNLAKAFVEDGNHVQAGLLIWSTPVDSRPWEAWSQGKEVAAYNHQSYYLAKREAPKNFFWESKALYCLPIRHVQFRAIYPSDHEKRLLWHPFGAGKNHKCEPIAVKYTFEVEDDKSIRLTVPYIPYSHFLTSRDFSGFPYQYYATVDEPNVDRDSWESWESFGLTETTCPVEKVKEYEYRSYQSDLAVWHPLGEGTVSAQALQLPWALMAILTF